MPKITFSDQSYECLPNENVLDCLARHQVALPSSCRAGICQTCLMKASAGTPPPESQQGLRPGLQKQGYFMACSCVPSEDLTLAMPDDNLRKKIEASIIEKQALNKDIMRLRLKPEIEIDFAAGQFINLHRQDDLVRSYSIASLPSEGFIELHVERITDGKVSGWVHDDLSEGEHVSIDGPHGECFYSSDSLDERLMLVGTGSGLAPLWGIARDALARGHQGDIHLYHGVRTADRLYLVDELKAIAAEHSNFHYYPCLSGEDVAGMESGRANEVALTQFPKLDSNWRLYLCGNPDMVSGLKKQGFLAGASLNKIHADPFVIAES